MLLLQDAKVTSFLSIVIIVKPLWTFVSLRLFPPLPVPSPAHRSTPSDFRLAPLSFRSAYALLTKIHIRYSDTTVVEVDFKNLGF